MRNFVLSCAVALFAVSAFAQTAEEEKEKEVVTETVVTTESHHGDAGCGSCPKPPKK